MEVVPYEVLFDLLLKIRNISDVIKMCSTNSMIKAICDSDYFWKLRFEVDYPSLSLLVPFSNQTYRQLYEWIMSIGIGSNLSIIMPRHLNDVLLVYPTPPFTITDAVYVPLTESTGRHYYSLSADAAIHKFKGKWKLVQYPRESDINERKDILYNKEPILWLNTLDDVKNIITQLLASGYYIIKNTSIPKSKLDKLQQKGLIGKINEHTWTETYD
jgi:hypothetical protein